MKTATNSSKFSSQDLPTQTVIGDEGKELLCLAIIVMPCMHIACRNFTIYSMHMDYTHKINSPSQRSSLAPLETCFCSSSLTVYS